VAIIQEVITQEIMPQVVIIPERMLQETTIQVIRVKLIQEITQVVILQQEKILSQIALSILSQI
jgi:hypothetical protein